ncbi:MAG: hypothetical protein C0607_17030 [Azoarcus sp.]|nr:MAG: hypothetical protein C0607_17030 [Azoarcus sp.]
MILKGHGLLAGLLIVGGAQAQLQDHSPVVGQGASTAVSPKAVARATGAPWSSLPTLSASFGGGRGAAALRLSGIDADKVTVFAPGGASERRVVDYPVADGRASIQASAPMMGNYHWAQAREVRNGVVRVASTVWYFSNPGDAPTALLDRPKSELEIVPQPLPREHAHYRESEKWRFLVRWQGQPLPGQALTLETEQGSRSMAFTDDEGVATLVFPRDLGAQKVEAGAHGRRERAGFVLSTAYSTGDQTYLTAFNRVYVPEAERSRSLAWGAAFGFVGMMIATPLLRRKESDHA